MAKTFTDYTPKEIVAELDKYIIGQDKAKRSVAVALRNRYRRNQLSEEMREEISPKNILMMGPTGVGKTEIARRLAKLMDAPFVKVEATKFTEVGYVGRDVDSMVLLPFKRENFVLDREEREEAKELKTTYTEYMPNVTAVLNNIVPSYVAGYIYSALVDSFCSEQSARMSAMDAANQNAEELLASLNLEYNHVRQGAITQEITEVSAGSRGQKKSKKKREEREEGLN